MNFDRERQKKQPRPGYSKPKVNAAVLHSLREGELQPKGVYVGRIPRYTNIQFDPSLPPIWSKSVPGIPFVNVGKIERYLTEEQLEMIG